MTYLSRGVSADLVGMLSDGAGFSRVYPCDRRSSHTSLSPSARDSRGMYTLGGRSIGNALDVNEMRPSSVIDFSGVRVGNHDELPVAADQ